MQEPLRSLWINSIKKFQPFDNSVSSFHVCSSHFLPTDIQISGRRKTIVYGKVPSIFPKESQQNINHSTSDSCESESLNYGVCIDEQSNRKDYEQEYLHEHETNNQYQHNDEQNLSFLFIDENDSNNFDYIHSPNIQHSRNSEYVLHTRSHSFTVL